VAVGHWTAHSRRSRYRVIGTSSVVPLQERADARVRHSAPAAIVQSEQYPTRAGAPFRAAGLRRPVCISRRLCIALCAHAGPLRPALRTSRRSLIPRAAFDREAALHAPPTLHPQAPSPAPGAPACHRCWTLTASSTRRSVCPSLPSPPAGVLLALARPSRCDTWANVPAAERTLLLLQPAAWPC
jgi:hypothetical protein